MQATDHHQGLTSDQVQSLTQRGLTNVQPRSAGKSVPRILFDNIFTFFNLINAILAALILSVGSTKNLLFLGIVVFNAGIGIFQELRAKRTLDRLTLMSAPRTSVIRSGQEIKVPIDQVVQGELLSLSTGDQIPADGSVVSGFIEVNESLLTGEADVVPKAPGDALHSGSYVVSGQAHALAERVGKESYAYQIAADAKTRKRHPSELRNAINRILKLVSFLILPLGAGLLCSQLWRTHAALPDAVVGTVAAVLGMIPEGLVLLTSIQLAVGVVNLGKKGTLVHELFCIETLARVDVLCLDKTGTLTEGRMQVDNVHPLAECDVAGIMGNLMRALPDQNATALALRDYFPAGGTWAEAAHIAFSSERKFSAASFSGHGSYAIGAFEFLFPNAFPEVAQRVLELTRDGARVIALAQGEGMITDGELPGGMSPIALICLSDVVRADAHEALEYFAEQGVDLMVISGDHPLAVAGIAQKAGFHGADKCADASTLTTPQDIDAAIQSCRVFGRVRPEQKREIVLALKRAGRTVAMTGDGVNDVPALKEAHCGIAMASGSDAAKSCADLVLLNSTFSTMPFIVKEGRRVINNIQSAASLFLVKTIFSVVLSVLALAFSMQYPFMPIQLTVINAFAVGIPTFILALEPNYARVQPGFFRRVLTGALTGALTVVGAILLATGLSMVYGWGEAVRSTLCVLLTGLVSLHMIRFVYPLTTALRKCVWAAMFVGFACSSALFWRLLELCPLPPFAIGIVAAFTVCTPLVLYAVGHVVSPLLERK